MSKISEYPSGTPENSDLLVYVDVSESETKKTTRENLFDNIVLKDSSSTTAGAIRWNGTKFQGYT